ncbi:MAG TPA: hypothetical protein VGR06_18795 [Actinophytocola sp.]|jgi:hypothetical protein|uniref:antibiotic biosynthesis monooxygenase family protein n=1 Tax=Actinophytocola sp. TaxID=1872138 RepID=UPI002E0336A1|nr:hypothetical protein [Actinophytocola sp.]
MTLEFVRFKLRDGVTDEELLEASRGVDAFLAEAPGFQSRQLYRDPTHWIDLVVWSDLAAARAAAARIADDPRCTAFMDAIAAGSVVLSHAELRSEHRG